MTDSETYQSYLFPITDWTVDYGLSIGAHHDPPTPYWDHLALKLTTTGIFSDRIEGRSFQFYFIADRDLDTNLGTAKPLHSMPTGIGTLTSRGDRHKFLGSLPHAFALGLLPAIESGRIKSILAQGDPMKWGRAQITTIHFGQTYDPEDH